MLIGIDSSLCSLSLRNRRTLCSTTKCHQNKSDLKNVFVQIFFSISSIFSIPIMPIGINVGYFPAICRVCFLFFNSHTAIAGAFIGLLLVYFLFRRRDFCDDHMMSQPLQICFLFILSCNFLWSACVTSFFALSGASFFVHSRD